MIPHSRPTITPEDELAVLNVLRSGELTTGKEVYRFEQEMSSYVGVQGGVAVSSGTAAIYLSLAALDIGLGDEVIIPSFVCSALLHAVRLTGAVPVISDIDQGSFNIDPNQIKAKLTKRTRAVIVPHMFGLPADMDEILSLGIPVIEDCAQSIGSTYKKRMTGNIGFVSAFSFYSTKLISTGEGGMVLSNDPQFLDNVRERREYDEKDSDGRRFNFKMTDFQAALGSSQLSKISSFLARRREIASSFTSVLSGKPVELPQEFPDRTHAYYRYVIKTDSPARFISTMEQTGIICRNPVFKPIHGYLGLTGYPQTERAWNRSVSLPIYPSLNKGQVDRIISALNKYLQ